MNLLDILILGFILFGALLGYQKGVISSIFTLLSYIVGFFIASWKYMSVLRWAEHYFPLQQWLEPVLYRAILPYIQAKASSIQNQASDSILGVLPWDLSSLIGNLFGVQMSQAVELVSHRLAGVFTELLLSLIAFCCVFFLVVIIIQRFFSLLFSPFGKWGGSLNRGGGLLFGGLSALMGMSIVAGLLSPLLQLGFGGSINPLIQNSVFYSWLLGIFRLMDQAFAAQLSHKLLEPLSQGQGVWF